MIAATARKISFLFCTAKEDCDRNSEDEIAHNGQPSRWPAPV